MGCNTSKPIVAEADSQWAVPRISDPTPVTAIKSHAVYSKVAKFDPKDLGSDDGDEVKRKVIELPKVRAPQLISSGNAQEAPQYNTTPRRSLPGGIEEIPEPVGKPVQPCRVIDDNQIREGSILAETRKKFDPARYQKTQQPLQPTQPIPQPTQPTSQPTQQPARDATPRKEILPPVVSPPVVSPPIVSPPIVQPNGPTPRLDNAPMDNSGDFLDLEDLCAPAYSDGLQLPRPSLGQDLPYSRFPAHIEDDIRVLETGNDSFDLFGEDEEALMKEILEEFGL